MDKIAMLCVLVLVVHVVVTSSRQNDSCPMACDCARNWYGHMSVICANVSQSLDDTLLSTPRDTRFLSITDSNFPRLENNTFSNFTRLLNLVLARNGIREIAGDAFVNCDNLKHLHLENNQISKLQEKTFSRLLKLETLKLDNNILENLYGLGELNVVTLTLNGNKLTDVDFEILGSLPNLKSLDLSENYIRQVSMMNNRQTSECTYFRSLTHLNLSGNVLQSFPFEALQNATSLQTLILSDNSIAGTFRISDTFTNLEVLDIQGNYISSIDNNAFTGMKSLEVLLLARNEINTIESSAFNDLGSLKHLDLSKMITLKRLAEDVLSNLHSLRTLALSHNPLLTDLPALGNGPLETLNLHGSGFTTFKEETFSALRSLRRVDIGGNPIKCDCHVAWIQTVLSQFFGRYSWVSGWEAAPLAPTCGSPDNLRGVRVGDVGAGDLTCNPPSVSSYGDMEISVRVQENFTFQAVMSGGLPSGTWIDPDGIVLHPGDLVSKPVQGSLQVTEYVVLEHFVATELSGRTIDPSFQGEYTLIAKNAASAESLVFTVNVSTDVRATDGSVSMETATQPTLGGTLLDKHDDVLGDFLESGDGNEAPSGDLETVTSFGDIPKDSVTSLSWFGISVAALAVVLVIGLFLFSLYKSRNTRVYITIAAPYERFYTPDNSLSYGAI